MKKFIPLIILIVCILTGLAITFSSIKYVRYEGCGIINLGGRCAYFTAGWPLGYTEADIPWENSMVLVEENGHVDNNPEVTQYTNFSILAFLVDFSIFTIPLLFTSIVIYLIINKTNDKKLNRKRG